MEEVLPRRKRRLHWIKRRVVRRTQFNPPNWEDVVNRDGVRTPTASVTQKGSAHCSSEWGIQPANQDRLILASPNRRRSLNETCRSAFQWGRGRTPIPEAWWRYKTVECGNRSKKRKPLCCGGSERVSLFGCLYFVRVWFLSPTLPSFSLSLFWGVRVLKGHLSGFSEVGVPQVH